MKILVVDDEPLIRRSLQRAFESKGHLVMTAENGLKGLECWSKESFDVVFLDVIMPELTGTQVLEKMGVEREGRVVLMSAYTADNVEDVKARFKVDLFLVKPFEDIFKVVSLVEGLLGGKNG